MYADAVFLNFNIFSFAALCGFALILLFDGAVGRSGLPCNRDQVSTALVSSSVLQTRLARLHHKFSLLRSGVEKSFSGGQLRLVCPMAKGNIIVTVSRKCSNHYILGARVLRAISMTDLSILFSQCSLLRVNCFTV